MKKIIVLISVLIIAGCAAAPKIKDEKDLSFHLTQSDIGHLPKPQQTRSVEDQQLLTTQLRGHELSFMSVLHRDNNGLRLTALSAVGVRLFAVDYDGLSVKVEKFIPNIRLPDVNDIIANIMLAYYDSKAWHNHLPKGWKIVDRGLMREVVNESAQVIIRIDYEQQRQQKLPIMITNHALKYTIHLKNLND